jgi:HEAT repeat protein
MNDTRVVEPLIQALNDKLPKVRYTAAESLGYIGDKRAVEPLIESINDKAHWVQYCAIEALGRIRDNRAVEPLIRYLEDKAKILPCHMYAGDEYIESRTVCIGANIDADNAIGALGEIGDPRAVEILIEILDKNSGMVGGYANGTPICAANALADIGDPRAVEPLTQDYEWFRIGWIVKIGQTV